MKSQSPALLTLFALVGACGANTDSHPHTEPCVSGPCEPSDEAPKPCVGAPCDPLEEPPPQPPEEPTEEPPEEPTEEPPEEPWSGCVVDGVKYASGDGSPDQPCAACVPSLTTETFSLREAGTSCGEAQRCDVGGACIEACLVEGVLYPKDALNPENPCEQCQPATSTVAWTTRESLPLFVGGEDHVAQGFTTVVQSPYTLSLGDGYTELATRTNSGASTSGLLLLTKAGVFAPQEPFTLRAVLQVVSADRHNALDSGAAFLGSFTPPFGNSSDRSQMGYLDSDAIGWSDDTQSVALSVTDGAYHTYELAVDASGVAVFSVDGVARLTRNNFVSNGTIALGDQTNDANVDGVMRIKSIDKLCL